MLKEHQHAADDRTEDQRRDQHHRDQADRAEQHVGNARLGRDGADFDTLLVGAILLDRHQRHVARRLAGHAQHARARGIAWRQCGLQGRMVLGRIVGARRPLRRVRRTGLPRSGRRLRVGVR
jgi:hypothetical protein